MKGSQWLDAGMRCFGMLIDGRAQPSGIRKRGGDATILLVFNGAEGGVNFTLPACAGGDEWTVMIDTNRPDAPPDVLKTGHVYTVTGRSVLAFGHPNESET
jgi:glycogen operon protein